MPYIPAEERYRFDGYVLPAARNIRCAGELNYCITLLIHEYLNESGLIGSNGYNYGFINAAVGALECAKLELYRMIAAPYEDKKRQENGRVLLEDD